MKRKVEHARPFPKGNGLSASKEKVSTMTNHDHDYADHLAGPADNMTYVVPITDPGVILTGAWLPTVGK
jgi:hypothetical protein